MVIASEYCLRHLVKKTEVGGHVTCMEAKRSAYKFLVGKPE